jgi:hypothetical protein
VRAGTGGTIPKAFGIMAKSNSYSMKHLARTHKPESIQDISNNCSENTFCDA